MANFKYEVMLPSGKSHKGDVAARDLAEASRLIRTQTGGTIIDLKRSSDFLSMQIGTVKIKPKVLALACSQFSILLRAGLPLARAINIVADQTTDKTLKSVLETVYEEVRVGASLADSFQKNIGALPIVFAETIRAGEDSGNLEHSFAKMEEYFTKSYKIKGKIMKALMYPAVLIIVAVVVVMIIVNVALPAFIPMFEGRDLPAPTQALLNMYNLSKEFWYVPIIVIIVLGIMFRSYQKSPLGKLKISGIAMKFPIIGKINTMLAASQYANTLATLLASGLPVVKCLEITSRVITNYATGLSIQDSIKAITEGALIGQAISSNEYLPKLVIEMTSVGEESGSLEETLATIGKYYDEEADAVVESSIAMLEPMITIVLGFVVAFILVALYMPMFEMYSGIG